MAPSAATSPTTSKSGIQTSSTGDSYIPASVRADGSKRKEIRVRPGYRPPEDVEIYKNRSATAFKNRGNGGVPGAEPALGDGGAPKSEISSKNAKRREARRRAAAVSQPDDNADAKTAGLVSTTQEEHGQDDQIPQLQNTTTVADTDLDLEKKSRNLKKKLNQARDLRQKKDEGEALLPEQLAKVVKINELIRELDMLGFDASGEKKMKTSKNSDDS
ncbi:MAG: hypothetical protein Q9227_002284 [Pyrenula ochraceoflavens]